MISQGSSQLLRVLAALATLTALPALAQVQTEHAETVYAGTERTMAFSLRFGSFLPGIDEQFDFSPGPYETVFGTGGDLAFSFLVDVHVWTGFGALSLGGSLGYWNNVGEGVPEAGSSATDKTEFQIWPMQAQLTYRFDPFADTVPLVPVLRAGVDYYAWEIQDGAGETATFGDGAEALGGTWGYHYAVGLHLLLDFFSPEMAVDFDRDAGVNSSYLTFDYEVSTVDDFGSAESFRLGAETFYIGIAIDL